MDMFVLGAVAVLAAMAGFWAGRSVQWQLAEAEGAYAEEPETAESVEQVRLRSRAGGMMSSLMERRKPVKVLIPGREVVSPATGQMSTFEEGEERKIRILPDYGKVYAPASGRIKRLYPMGSAMLLRTEFGADIMIQIGSNVDEMCSGFYRCRVMEHEIVRKGALLLEYDPAAVTSTGANPEIILTIENEEDLEKVTVTGSSRIKSGEPLLYIACKEGELYESSRGLVG
ncbi:MAG: PTS glucose transporter subunit IIA [Muribaculum sp.]|nr:PTS glucose transporter subunit IIA [Muribaculum sp.]